MGELWESRVQSEASQRVSLSLLDPPTPSTRHNLHPHLHPLLRRLPSLCFSFGRESQEASSRSHAAALNNLVKQTRFAFRSPSEDTGVHVCDGVPTST